jgi:hypothetical protein
LKRRTDSRHGSFSWLVRLAPPTRNSMATAWSHDSPKNLMGSPII